MQRIVIGLLASAVISGTAWAQTNVSPAESSVAAMAPVSTPKTWVDYITVKGDVRLRGETINDDSKKNSSGEDYTRDRLRIKSASKG